MQVTACRDGAFVGLHVKVSTCQSCQSFLSVESSKCQGVEVMLRRNVRVAKYQGIEVTPRLKARLDTQFLGKEAPDLCNRFVGQHWRMARHAQECLRFSGRSKERIVVAARDDQD